MGTDRFRRPAVRSAWRLAALPAALLVASCAQHSPDALSQVRARGVLRVVTLNAPTDYYLGAHGPQGYEYRLAASFARSLGLTLSVQPVLDAAAMRAALEQGRADVAAAQISSDAAWSHVALATRPYREIGELLVRAAHAPRVRSAAQLCGARVVIRADSPQRDLLQAARRHLPCLVWREQRVGQTDPLELLEHGAADYALVDADEFTFARHIYPDVAIAFEWSRQRSVRWMVRSDAPALAREADRFFAQAARSGELGAIQRLAAGESEQFNYIAARRFASDITDRLPAIQDLFEQAAQATGIDWRLLAAVGYQESKWQMQAVSDDGARGIMMLTVDAASRIGIADRNDLRQNILGGARYLAEVMHTIPAHVPEPDRTWLALAAYNVGYGHLEDARVLTQKLGGDPDSWADVRRQLPLLAEQQWYAHARRGYARGWEPATFVEQVRQYLSVLEWYGTTQLSMRRPQRLLRAALAGGVARYD